MGGCVSTTSTRDRNRNRDDTDTNQPIPLNPLPASSSTARPSAQKTPTSSHAKPAPGSTPAGTRGDSSSSVPSLRSRQQPKSSKLDMPRPSLNALRNYATLPNPSSSLPASVLLFANAQTLVIFDAYPKAKYHFLVLPRYPFPPQSDPDSPDSIIRLDHLDDLRSLLLKPSRDVRNEVIRAMVETAREVEEMVRDEMIKTEGFEWKIDVGFHAVPSMKHVHLHIISEDRISPSLKTKKHHNSFRPDLGFFLDVMEVERWLDSEEQFLRERVAALSGLEPLLESTLSCFKCDEPFSSMPKLKAHLEKEFEKEKKKALKRIKTTGRQRSSDEDDIF